MSQPAIRTNRFEIAYSAVPEHWGKWCTAVQRLKNAMVQRWLLFHTDAGSRKKLLDWRDDLIAWHREQEENAAERKAAKKGRRKAALPHEKRAKPKCPVQCWDRGIDVYQCVKEVRASYVGGDNVISATVLNLAKYIFLKAFQKRSGEKSAFKRWQLILMEQATMIGFDRPQPLPFDKKNSSIVPTDKGYNLRVSMDDVGPIEIPLLVHKRKAWKQKHILERIESGRYVFKGSEIVWDARKRKWFCHLCWQDTESQTADLDKSRHAVLSPGKNDPWILDKGDGNFPYRGGTGRHITAMRKRVLSQRQSRMEHYRYAGANRKGHGRKHATGPHQKLTAIWKNFQKRYNNQVTTDVVRELVNSNIGQLIYLQPTGAKSESRFLSWAGTDDHRLAGWEYFQIKTMLEQKCARAGIEFVVRQCGATGRMKSREEERELVAV